MVGEEAASKSGQFTVLNCLDGSSGTLACVVKEGVKLYFYNIRTLHVESSRNKAIETALADAVAQGMAAKDAAKVAQKEGAKAAKLATRKAKRIIGPIISSGWDFFEALYFGGTLTEGFLRGTGTLFGTYYVGFIAERRFGRFGYLVGSHLGSWVGGRVGLMVYDVASGLHFMLGFSEVAESIASGDPSSEKFTDTNNVEYTGESEENNVENTETFGENNVEYTEEAGENNAENSEEAGDSYINEPTWSSSVDESNGYETYADESVDAHEEL